jgi:hypothetical protein
MYDFSAEVSKFHRDHVRLSEVQRGDMTRRRDLNRDRIVAGLAEMGKPALVETINQGGNAMKTMTHPPEGNEDSQYDIDMGVVFNADDTLLPRTTKGWVRDAIARKATNLKYAPEAKPKCVRVEYADGYQCDFPVFRRKLNGDRYSYEIAINDEWVASDPLAINAWFHERVRTLSPEAEGSYQLRRVTRLVKYFAKVHAFRTGLKFPAGLVATALAVECYVPADGRDDESFYQTLVALSRRSEHLQVWANGVVISGARDVDRIRRLADAATDAVAALAAIGDNTTPAEARKAWKKVFRHSFFDEASASNALRAPEVKAAGLAAPALISSAIAAMAQSDRAERLQSAVDARQGAGGASQPWAR